MDIINYIVLPLASMLGTLGILTVVGLIVARPRARKN